MQQRRITRLTNGFSKKLRNHKAAVALYVAHYNLCRGHDPGDGAGRGGSHLGLGELIKSAMGPELEGRPAGRFRVIDGGLL